MKKAFFSNKTYLENYLKRINYYGNLNPSLELLSELQKKHLLNIPFENLDIHYNKKIHLDINAIYQKIIGRKRGGFCYELNGLFYELLKSLEYDVKMISARVFNNKNGYGAEFDHMAIIVRINAINYLVDVGFGEFTFKPFKMELDKVQKDPRGNFLINKHDKEYFSIKKIVNNKEIPEYIFTETHRKLADFEDMCTYHQTSSESNFTSKRLISLPIIDGRYTITGNTFKIRDSDGVSIKEFKNENEFKGCLVNIFKVKLGKK